jgi:hypothetical protein
VTVPHTATNSLREELACWKTSCWGTEPRPMVKSPATKVTTDGQSAEGQKANLPAARACSTTGATPATCGMSATR